MEKKENLKVPLFNIRGSVYDDFTDYLHEQKELQKIIRARNYTVKETGISYRVINHWDEKGILPGDFALSGEGWRKFSFVEIVWLRIVVELRKFGLPLETISRIKEHVMIWSDEDQTYPWFEYFVAKTPNSVLDGYLVARADGTADLVFSRAIEREKIIRGSRSFILISFKEVFQSIKIPTVKPESLFSLSDDEIDVLGVIRSGEVDKITLKLKEGIMKSIDTSKTVSGSNMKTIKEDLSASGDYADVISKFESGQEQSAEIIKKRRF